MEKQPFLDRYKVFRRIALLWAMVIITIVIFSVFEDVEKINAAVVSALSVVVGLMATMVAFYQHSRTREDTNIRAIGLEELAYRDLLTDEEDNYVASDDPH